MTKYVGAIVLICVALIAAFVGWLIGYRAGWQAAQPVTLESGRK